MRIIFTKGLNIRQVDKTQSFEIEESCRLIKEHFGNGSFFFKPVNELSKYLTGFHKNHNTQNSLRMLESWKAELNNGSKDL